MEGGQRGGTSLERSDKEEGRHIILCQVSLASRHRSQVGANIWSRLWHWSGLEILQEFALCERHRRSTVPSCEEIQSLHDGYKCALDLEVLITKKLTTLVA